jgi:hypothetical protein
MDHKFSIGLRLGKLPGHSDLDLLQNGHDLPAGKAGGLILKEVICSVVLLPEQKLVLQHGDIAVSVHCDLERGKVEGAPAPMAAEAPPHHDPDRVLHVPDGVALLVSAGLA